MKKLLVFVAAVLFIAVAVHADVYIKTNVHTDPVTIMGQSQPAKDTVTETWLGNGKLANFGEGRIMILDMGKNVMYIVSPKDKSYVETSLPLDMAKLLPPEAAGMMGMMKATVKVTPNGQTKQIGKWSCNGYDVDMNMMMMQMKMKVWASTNVPFDWKTMSALFANLSKMQFIDEAGIKELMKINGYQIASEMTMSIMGANVRVTQQVQEIVEKAAPAGTYSVPAGFTKKTTMSLQDLRNQ